MIFLVERICLHIGRAVEIKRESHIDLLALDQLVDLRRVLGLKVKPDVWVVRDKFLIQICKVKLVQSRNCTGN